MMNRLAISDEMIARFAHENGAQEVWRSWRDNMLEQGRGVSEKRMNWSTLSQQDKELDANISFDVIRDFVVWWTAHEEEAPCDVEV